MIMEIDDKIIKAAVNCKRCFACLAGGGKMNCKVESSIRNELLFVKCLTKDPCNYKSSFGNKNICKCPVRIEIFRKYKK